MTFRSLRPESVHGRQAEARRNDLVVLEAARDVFTARGAGAPVSAVAERAGVGMGTLYRRYGSKTELLQRLCMLAMDQALAAADDALAASDPWDGLSGYIRACVELRSGALATLAGQIETTAEMRSTARRSMARLAEIVARAHADGTLRSDATALDISWLIEQFSRRAPDRVDPDEERNMRSRLVAITLDGLRARTGEPPDARTGEPPDARTGEPPDARTGERPSARANEPLPGRPPSRSRYVSRWSPRS